MVTLMPVSLKTTDENPEYTLTRILADAIDQRKVPAGASAVLGYSQHLNNEQQQQFVVRTEAGDYFVKRQPESASSSEQFEAESHGLLTIAASHSIRTAVPYATGSLDGYHYILLSHLSLAVHGDWRQAGQQIARLHGCHAEQGYGFDTTSYCGATPLDNHWNTDWANLYTHQRIEPLLKALTDKGEHITGANRLLVKCEEILKGHTPDASLLHGDLWSGNIGFIPDPEGSVPVIYDPACYFGDAETDLAMTELFGRFPESFYQGYREFRAIDEGYEERRDLYQLFHLLNHALLFSGHYAVQCRDLIRKL